MTRQQQYSPTHDKTANSTHQHMTRQQQYSPTHDKTATPSPQRQDSNSFTPRVRPLTLPPSPLPRRNAAPPSPPQHTHLQVCVEAAGVQCVCVAGLIKGQAHQDVVTHCGILDPGVLHVTHMSYMCQPHVTHVSATRRTCPPPPK
jgi:hypothetical protein